MTQRWAWSLALLTACATARFAPVVTRWVPDEASRRELAPVEPDRARCIEPPYASAATQQLGEARIEPLELTRRELVVRTCEYRSSLNRAFRGCVEGRCDWFVQDVNGRAGR